MTIIIKFPTKMRKLRAIRTIVQNFYIRDFQSLVRGFFKSETFLFWWSIVSISNLILQSISVTQLMKQRSDLKKYALNKSPNTHYKIQKIQSWVTESKSGIKSLWYEVLYETLDVEILDLWNVILRITWRSDFLSVPQNWPTVLFSQD